MKLARQAKILELIGQEAVETQEELAKKLKQCGFQVTQATVSRDIRELKLTKRADKGGKSRYVAFQGEGNSMDNKYIRVLQNAFVSMDVAQNFLVIHTVSGMAMAAAAALDEMMLKELVGCIAGDNTIMCAAHSPEEAVRLMEQIEKLK